MSTRKKFDWLVISAFLVAITAQPGVVSAYGGGPGLPPGLPTYTIQMVCTNKTIKLPFAGSITIPQCRVKKDEDFHQRLRDFIDRVIHGDHR